MTRPLLAVAAHRAIDRQQALLLLLADESPRDRAVDAADLDKALPFIAACQRVYVTQHQVETREQS